MSDRICATKQSRKSRIYIYIFIYMFGCVVFCFWGGVGGKSVIWFLVDKDRELKLRGAHGGADPQFQCVT